MPEIHRRRGCRRALDETRSPCDRAAVRKRQRRRVPQLRRDTAAEPPLHANRPREVAGGLNDPRFDLHLRLWRVERSDDRQRLIDGRLQVREDECVRAGIDLHRAALRERAPGHQARDLIRSGVVQGTCGDAQLARERLLLRQLPALLFFIGEHPERRDPHDRPVDDVPQFVRAEDDVQCLIPRYVTHRDVHCPAHRRIDHDTQPADVGKRAQHCSEVCPLEIQGHRRAGERPPLGLHMRQAIAPLVSSRGRRLAGRVRLIASGTHARPRGDRREHDGGPQDQHQRGPHASGAPGVHGALSGPAAARPPNPIGRHRRPAASRRTQPPPPRRRAADRRQ